MGSRDVVVMCVVMALGCGGETRTDAGAAPGNEAGIAPGNEAGISSRCAGLEDELRTAIATHGTCDIAADCQLVAGPAYFGCDAEPFLIDCGGVPVERNAPGRARAEELTRAFFDTHCDAGQRGNFDCAPQVLHCNADHHCTGTMNSCLPAPPDAGVDAGLDAGPEAGVAR
jgi:hypothetical protein